MHHLEVRRLASAYGSHQVLHDLSLTIAKGQVVSLIGPSGSGKSTVLRVLMGLTSATAGEVLIDGERVDYRSRRSLRSARDRMAIVFQQYNLFQNMSVLGNVTITPVRIRGRPAAEVEADARRLLAKVGLAGKEAAFPDQLSGGQQQRVAIARALALRPQILLLDEVTSALDPELVGEVLDTIRSLAADGMTMLIVSHEMGFVREVSSKIVMMDQGRLVEEGPPAQIFDAATTERTRSFVGRVLRH
ncbi:MAG: amino acid ABC transporter ATP-binding protein [Geminicoccaceae bacterium]